MRENLTYGLTRGEGETDTCCTALLLLLYECQAKLFLIYSGAARGESLLQVLNVVRL
jgi:hypothetical protein